MLMRASRKLKCTNPHVCCCIIQCQAIEGIKKQEQKYDIALMDCQMPEINGYELTHIIRNLDAGKNLPIIAFTAHALWRPPKML